MGKGKEKRRWEGKEKKGKGKKIEKKGRDICTKRLT